MGKLAVDYYLIEKMLGVGVNLSIYFVGLNCGGGIGGRGLWGHGV